MWRRFKEQFHTCNSALKTNILAASWFLILNSESINHPLKKHNCWTENMFDRRRDDEDDEVIQVKKKKYEFPQM